MALLVQCISTICNAPLVVRAGSLVKRGRFFGTILRKRCWFEVRKNTWQEFTYVGFHRNDRFVAEMRHVLACLQGHEQPKVDVIMGSQVLQLALAAKASASKGHICQVMS